MKKHGKVQVDVAACDYENLPNYFKFEDFGRPHRLRVYQVVVEADVRVFPRHPPSPAKQERLRTTQGKTSVRISASIAHFVESAARVVHRAWRRRNGAKVEQMPLSMRPYDEQTEAGKEQSRVLVKFAANAFLAQMQ